MNRRCVITGMGAVTPIGNTVEEFWENIKSGVCGVDYIKAFDTEEFKVKLAAEVKDFDPVQYINKKEVKRNDYFSIYALAAAQQAFDMSKINIEDVDASRFGVIVGSGVGGLTTIQEQILKLGEKGPSKVSPLFIPMVIENMAAGNISIRFGTKGMCTSAVTACATGTHCIGDAYRNIKHGYLDMCFAGGAEASINQIAVAGFTNITALSKSQDPKRASIPFDKNRDGFVIGEGAGILILEELEHAKERGATIYGEVVGYGATGDAYHMTAPSPDGIGAATAMTIAMEEAGITAKDIAYINAHGTSTPLNDESETKAIKLAFKDHAYNVAISSTKSMTGHLLGAAGAIEAIVCINALRDGFAPPTIGYGEKDENCDLDYTPNVGRKIDARYALSNSLGFGGHNGVLCIKKWEGK